MPLKQVRKIPVADIRRGRGMMMRRRMDKGLIQEYARLMEDGVKFPPIEVRWDEGEQVFWLVDGWHRIEAHIQVHGPDSKIQARIVPGDRLQAIWAACAANATHGRRRNREDIARVVEVALRHPNAAEMSDRALARYLQVDHKTVAKYRKILEALGKLPYAPGRIGADGVRRAIGANRNWYIVQEPEPEPEARTPRPKPPQLIAGLPDYRRLARDQTLIEILKAVAILQNAGRSLEHLGMTEPHRHLQAAMAELANAVMLIQEEEQKDSPGLTEESGA